jgi:hypothetical protein
MFLALLSSLILGQSGRETPMGPIWKSAKEELPNLKEKRRPVLTLQNTAEYF